MMEDDYTNQQQWGYAALSVSIITLTAIFGLVLIPLAHKRIWIYVQDFLLALATATLLCDAILHLLPHGLGLHADHEEEGHAEHDDSDDHDERVLNITNNGSKTGDEDSHAGEFILVWKLNVMVITRDEPCTTQHNTSLLHLCCTCACILKRKLSTCVQLCKTGTSL
jgi:hypothetical protein